MRDTDPEYSEDGWTSAELLYHSARYLQGVVKDLGSSRCQRQGLVPLNFVREVGGEELQALYRDFQSKQ